MPRAPLTTGPIENARAQLLVEQLYVEHRSAICSYLLYLGIPRAQAPELTHDVFLRYHQSLRKGGAIDNPRAWLYRVAHNLATDTRSKERTVNLPEVAWERMVSANTASPETILLDREKMTRLRGALETLSPQQKICLYLWSEGLRYREIADILAISASSVNEFLRRALLRLGKAVDG